MDYIKFVTRKSNLIFLVVCTLVFLIISAFLSTKIRKNYQTRVPVNFNFNDSGLFSERADLLRAFNQMLRSSELMLAALNHLSESSTLNEKLSEQSSSIADVVINKSIRGTSKPLFVLDESNGFNDYFLIANFPVQFSDQKSFDLIIETVNHLVKIYNDNLDVTRDLELMTKFFISRKVLSSALLGDTTSGEGQQHDSKVDLLEALNDTEKELTNALLTKVSGQTVKSQLGGTVSFGSVFEVKINRILVLLELAGLHLDSQVAASYKERLVGIQDRVERAESANVLNAETLKRISFLAEKHIEPVFAKNLKLPQLKSQRDLVKQLVNNREFEVQDLNTRSMIILSVVIGFFAWLFIVSVRYIMTTRQLLPLD